MKWRQIYLNREQNFTQPDNWEENCLRIHNSYFFWTQPTTNKGRMRACEMGPWYERRRVNWGKLSQPGTLLHATYVGRLPLSRSADQSHFVLIHSRPMGRFLISQARPASPLFCRYKTTSQASELWCRLWEPRPLSMTLWGRIFGYEYLLLLYTTIRHRRSKACQ